MVKLKNFSFLLLLCLMIVATWYCLSNFFSKPNNPVITRGTNVEEKVDRCMRMAKLGSELLITQAKRNAKYFFEEYRKVIPENGLKGYRSHCWKEHYFTEWSRYQTSYSGRIGNINFPNTSLSGLRYDEIFPSLTRQFPDQHYESSLVCLPNVFMAGFAKCGSTYLFSFIERLIYMSTNNWGNNQLKKEIEFWIRFTPFRESRMYRPKVEHLGRYLLNYIPGIEKISKSDKRDVMLVEGTTNTIRDWPRFSKEENNLTNYCLIPATVPTLFPDSKFIAIMRNPIDMVYSQFWYSCTSHGRSISNPFIGPDVFHKRMISKIHMFNDCMRDESMPTTCTLRDRTSYSSCIKNRLHLLDKCYAHVFLDIYTPEMPECGSNWLSEAIYYVNVHKWHNLVARERMLFLTLEELKLDPSRVAGEILQFLNLNTSKAHSTEDVKRILQVDQKKFNAQETGGILHFK